MSKIQFPIEVTARKDEFLCKRATIEIDLPVYKGAYNEDPPVVKGMLRITAQCHETQETGPDEIAIGRGAGTFFCNFCHQAVFSAVQQPPLGRVEALFIPVSGWVVGIRYPFFGIKPEIGDGTSRCTFGNVFGQTVPAVV